MNYYPYPELLPEDNGPETNPKTPERWARIRSKYYTAATGDHVTIAPTHASMAEAATIVDSIDGVVRTNPKREFSANGQYLVVTAQRQSQYGEGQEPAKPVLVRRDNGRGELVQIKVNPRPVEFSLEADDKVYDGTTAATGTLRIDNAFRQTGQVDATNRDVTDMVFPVTGADYEDAWGAKLTTEGNESFSEYVSRNGYRFATGAEGYQYGAEGTMTFSFLDPNVAYVTEPTVHDVYGPLTTKGVQVKGLHLAGADAVNYTLQVGEVTPDNVGTAGGLGYLSQELPQATIRKADRAPMALGLLPTVEVNPATNVVRILYDQSTANIQGGEESAYQRELHFEYALQYMDALAPETEGEESTYVVEQMAGQRGELLWWDERFYGGETVTVEYPEGYVPEEEDIPSEDDIGEDTIRKGQVYVWAQEDPGFVLDDSAYPGGRAWPGYELYKTERTALDRDRIYWPVVRVAETHNYNASPAISSVAGYTPEMIQAVLTAQNALSGATSDSQLAAARQALAQASETALGALTAALEGARSDAEGEKSLMAQSAESGKLPEEWTGRAPASAVKTYAQSLELVSVAEPKKSSSTPGAEEIKELIPTLEAVWFTDVQEYPEKKLMDAVARNLSPVRYQDYAWDEGLAATLFGDDQGSLSLAAPFEVTYTKKGESGGETTETILVNQDNRARIYVQPRSNSSGGGLIPVESIRIDSDDLVVQIGAEPIQLKVILTPASATFRTVLWSSSDESVAIVDRYGNVTFVGEGIAVITARSVDGPSDSITVTVRGEQSWLELFPNSIFNVGLEEPFFQMREGEMLFHPQWEMTRGEVAQLLARFYVENPNWTLTGPENFPDLTGEESYASAARLLGSVGVFRGLPDGSFGGEQFITRAEFITLLTRMLGMEIPDTTGEAHAFLDAGEEDTWAYREIDTLTGVPGVVLGVGDGRFAPNRAITRAEAAVFLTRLLQFPLVGENPVIPRDVGESHWARGSILRAVNRGAAPVQAEQS